MINLDADLSNADWLKPGKGLPSDMDTPSKDAAIEAPTPNGKAAEHKNDSEG
jgi:hypothetical protein